MSSSFGDVLAKMDLLMALSWALTMAVVGIVEYLISGALQSHQRH
jgi:hypothetical protein